VLYRFGTTEVDAVAFKLRRDGRELPLQRKVFDVLHYLITNRERVVSKTELLDAVWRGEHVNESAVPWSISHVREALGQTRGSKVPIETVHGRGYRFSADVEEEFERSGTRANAAALSLQQTAQAKSASLPFVGRVEVMRRLVAKLTHALHGSGGLCLISGEAGIGKTRCANELSVHATQLGFTTWVGRALEDPGTPSFWPWTQILREAVHARPNMRDVGERLLARLAALDPAGLPLVDNNPEASQDTVSGRFWLQHELTHLLLRTARTKPLLLVLDDLHWADAGSLNLLVYLAPELANARILVVATQREDMPLAETCRPPRLLRHAERFQLMRLTAAEVGDYIAQLSASEQAPMPLSLAVHRASTGNPLFVQETVRALILEHGQDALRSLEPSAVKVPSVARDVLRTRLSALSADVRALLSRASVLGESFELPLLQALCDVAPDELLRLVEVATQHGLIVAETPQRYAFSHALMRALSYEDTSTAVRVALHRRAAEALEALESAEPRYGEIAHHYYRSLPAGKHAPVVAAAMRAARAAERVLAYEDAARFYDWALEAQALDPAALPRDRAELLLACGRALRHAGRRRDARETIRRSVELARQHGYGDLLMRAARMLRPTFAMSRVPDPLARYALDEVLRIAQEGPNSQRIVALSQLACLPPYADDIQRSKQLSQEALDLARRFGERPSLFEALRSRLYALSGPDDIDALLTVANEILELDREGPTVKSIEAYIARIGAYMYRGEHAAAGQAVEALGRAARELRLPEAIWYYDLQLANRAFLQGDFASAEAACPDLSKRSARMQLSYGKTFIAALSAGVAIERNGLEVFLASFDTSMLSELGPNPARYVRARFIRRSAERGRRDLALIGLDAFAAQGLEAIPKDIGYLNTLANMSLAVVLLGELERAEQLYALLSPYPNHNTPDVLLFDEGSASRYLALLAACLGWHERVEAHFERALAMNRSMRRANQIASTCYDYASWLKGQSQPGAAARARELAIEARDSAQAVGMLWLAGRAAALVS
jgi:DNA-binding winged helix-turn-helix (wHTH) protein/tetratricopeptide (TPR) repeat protein